MKLIYQAGSDTVRQMPENYLVAYRRERRWICDPDPSADVELATKVFILLFQFGYKYGSGAAIVEEIEAAEVGGGYD